VVCTRNRSAALAGYGAAWLGHESSVDWELLLVDNGSSDDTREVAAALVGARPARARLVVEPTLGLSSARNLGVRLARGAWIAFLDDDATPAPGWLDAYERALAGPGALAAGGPIDPDFAAPPPAWLGREFLPYLSAWDRGNEPHRLAYAEYPRGTNMAFRREAFERFGNFDLRLGRRGRSLRSCEEIELCLRIERGGGEVAYEPGARVRHRVESARLSPRWLIRRFAAQGFSEAIVEWKHFGREGLRRGLERQRAGARLHEERLGRDALFAACHRRAARAYLRGALYSVLVVERWRPPVSGAAVVSRRA
jgi:glycosyltransferase involved in cell wall biosynthesis